jgi:hypothetical protein
MKTQTVERKEREARALWWQRLEIVDCVRPPVCTVHRVEVTTVVCHECLKERLGLGVSK